jgi:hypothetical protein
VHPSLLVFTDFVSDHAAYRGPAHRADSPAAKGRSSHTTNGRTAYRVFILGGHAGATTQAKKECSGAGGQQQFSMQDHLGHLQNVF